MKKVDFGYANELNPNGSFEGIGLGYGGTGAVSAEFIDVMRINDDNYLVTKITDVFKGSEYEIGKYDVRKAIADLFPDGSAIMYLDQEHSSDCLKLEEVLNSEKVRTLLEKGVSVKDICSAYNAPLSFLCATHSNLVMATAIKHEVFEKKKELISKCRSSFSDMRKEMDSLELNHTNEYGRTF